MFRHIDTLHQSILQDLAQQPPALPELAAALKLVKADGTSKANEKRATLERWACDVGRPEEERVYAQEILRELPKF